jgi:di/tricarboxylate transporter
LTSAAFLLIYLFIYFVAINLDKVRERYQALGRMTWPEIVVLVDFGVLVVLWYPSPQPFSSFIRTQRTRLLFVANA